MRTRCEKVFGAGSAVPLDGDAKARIMAYARAWTARNRQPGQHKGPTTRAFLDVLQALLVGLPQQPHRDLLPLLRADRGEGGVRPRLPRRSGGAWIDEALLRRSFLERRGRATTPAITSAARCYNDPGVPSIGRTSNKAFHRRDGS
jgi:hypothetical protein